ncbi:hypothetical protein BLA18110_06485 [Burkholderia lata]|uniref:hypothetical protein n=1 Tax=Burkholderia lata (strain ATCC 17760 / DSM 23089 / LMG 22485 / NCIMB 9086 / R18194 / 383) TaxID=482957 RepID=UPI0014544759|nr:hypothetical protein [Burkholderia lata]VWD35761.1 hypothetical protein BLA18110_06485 [Burkholderia lata]
MRGMSAVHGGVDSRCGRQIACFHGSAGCNALRTGIPSLHDGIDMRCAKGARIDEVPAGQRGLSRTRRIVSGWCVNGAQADEQARGATGATGLLSGDSADNCGPALAAHGTPVGMCNRMVNLNIRGEWRIIF